MKITQRKIVDLDERMRALNEFSLGFAEAHLSPQTGYLHYCHHLDDENVHQTIPVYENVLYIYSLLKTKTFENVAESKKLLQNLLYFQSSTGNFPLYLHQFPHCHERFLGLELLIPFYYIYSQYRLVLGENLNVEIKKAIVNLLRFCIVNAKEKVLSYSKKITLGVVSHTFGSLFEIDEFVETGTLLLNEIEEDLFVIEWFNPETRGRFLTLFQLNNPLFSYKKWKKFWSFIQDTYDPNTGSYIGPALESYQQESEPETSIVDFHYSAITGLIPNRLSKLRISGLSACLIQTYIVDNCELIRFSDDNLKDFKNKIWGYEKKSKFALSYFLTHLDKEALNWKGIIPFKMSWGTLDHLHTLVAQGGNYQTVSTSFHENSIVLEYKLSDVVDVEDREMKKEVIFAVDQNADTEIFIESIKATTFKLHETVKIISTNLTLTLTFFIIEGEGEFFGHIMPGNRPSQLATKNANRFQAYDQLIFLRTLRRSKNCRIGLKICIVNE